MNSLRRLTLILTICATFGLSTAEAGWRDWFRSAGDVAQEVIKEPAMQQAAGAALSESEIISGLKEALAKGTTNAINQLGQTDGFWQSDAVRIPMPATVERAESTLRTFGLGNVVDDFHLSLNRAAERAVPEVADIFGNAIRAMTIDDARALLNGPDNAATEFFRRTTRDDLFTRVQPLVAAATDQVGVTRQYKEIEQRAGPVASLLQSQNPNLDAFVTDHALDGLFDVLTEQEAQFRNDPASRTSDILEKVFGQR